MGYCIELIEKNFKIKKENAKNVVDALRNFALNFTNKYNNRIMWVDKQSLIDSQSIEESFEEIRYPLTEDKNGDYVIDYFSGKKIGDDYQIFNAIAKYVEPNSFITFEGEDGDVFQFVFDGERCKYKWLYNVNEED